MPPPSPSGCFIVPVLCDHGVLSVSISTALPHRPCAAVVKGTPIIVWGSWTRAHRPIFPVLAFAFQDTPWRSMWALTSGHSGASGCDFCFQRGSTTNDKGDRLGAVRWLGCYHSSPFCIFDEEGVWSAGSFKLMQDDDTFDTARANALKVTDPLHKLRCAEAEHARQRAFQRYPVPKGAHNGGNPSAIPNSDEQKKLTQGVHTC